MCYVTKEEYIATHFNSFELVNYLTDSQMETILCESLGGGKSIFDDFEQNVADYPDWLYRETDMFANYGIVEGSEPYCLLDKAEKRIGKNLSKNKREVLKDILLYTFECGTEYALKCVSREAHDYISALY